MGKSNQGLRLVTGGGPKNKGYTVLLPAPTADALVALAESLDRPVSWVIRRLVEAELKHRAPKL